MTDEIEHRLRDAIKAYTSLVEPAPDGWDRISQRLIGPRRPDRHWLVALAGAALVLVIAVAVVGFYATRTTAPATRPNVRMPSRVVAVDSKGAVVVLDARSGKIEQQLGDGADASTSIAVRSDGMSVLFDRPSATRWCGPATREVLSVDLTTGALQTRPGPGVAQQAISPDGKKLAQLSLFSPPGPSYCAEKPQSILVLYPGKRDPNGPAWTVPSPFEAVRGPLSWAPDSRHLLFTLDPGTGGLIRPRLLDTRATSEELDSAPIVPISASTGVYGYLGRTGDLLGTVNIGSGARFRGERVAAIDPKTGSVRKVLFEIRGIGYTGPLASDPSGQHILVPTFDRNGHSTGLYRWNKGDKKPTKVADGIAVAAWLPDR